MDKEDKELIVMGGLGIGGCGLMVFLSIVAMIAAAALVGFLAGYAVEAFNWVTG